MSTDCFEHEIELPRTQLFLQLFVVRKQYFDVLLIKCWIAAKIDWFNLADACMELH